MRAMLWAVTAAAITIFPAFAQPEARFETNMGNFTVLLEPDKAPATVANFVRYVKQGHYNGTIFYRVVPDFVVQAGSLGADGKWRKLNKPIGIETATGLSNKRGTIAMARDEKPLSTQAEFFINLSDSNAQGLDPKPADAPNTTGYAVFGHVTSGIEVIDAIAGVPLNGGEGPFPANNPKTKVIIKKVTMGEAVPAPVPPPSDAAAPVSAAPVNAAPQTPATPQ